MEARRAREPVNRAIRLVPIKPPYLLRMKEIQSLTLQNIEDVFRNSSSFSREEKLEFSIADQQGVSFLEVKGEGVLQQYVLVKVLDWPKKDPLSSLILQPRFIIEDKNGQKYGAFERCRLTKLEQVDANNLSQLKVILKNLAKIQAKYCSVNEVDNAASGHILNDVAKRVTSLSNFKDIEAVKIATVLEDLQNAANKLSKVFNLVVQSQWCSGNVYISPDKSNVVFLQTSSGLLLPPAYDAFFLIFWLSNEKFRQYHFEDLASYYFQSLAEALGRENQILGAKITKAYIESQSNILLPIVKLAVIDNLSFNQNSEQFKELASNLANYLKYPEIHQEEVYHVVKTKLSSSDYDLLKYSLVQLGENNGHLGNYFHLRIAVRFQNKEEKFRLFAKIIAGATAALKELAESGIADRESFFYSTLCDLCQKHGLQELMDFAPECYMFGSRALVLDDLSNIGFTSHTPDTVINFDGLQIILEKLAKFHATTFILEERLSQKSGKGMRFGDKYPGLFDEPIMVQDGSMGEWMSNRFKSIFILLEKLPELTKDVDLTEMEIENRLKKSWMSVFKNVQSSKALRNVINHGDMYVGNMLFKLAKDQSVLDALLIDFQLLRYLPPALEVQFFIKMAADKETRNKYEKVLQDSYYENLSRYLKKFDLEPEEIYSRNDYNKDLSNTKGAASLISYCYGCLMFADPKFREVVMLVSEKVDYYLVNHQDEYFDVVLQDEKYKRRITGIMEDIIECIKSDAE